MHPKYDDGPGIPVGYYFYFSIVLTDPFFPKTPGDAILSQLSISSLVHMISCVVSPKRFSDIWVCYLPHSFEFLECSVLWSRECAMKF